MADDVQRTLGRIEGKLDAVLQQQEDHKRRIDDLEGLKNKALGIAAIIGSMVGLIGTSIGKAIAAIMHGGTNG